MNTKSKGERSEAHVLAALLLAGKVVLKPWGDNQRYDLVIDEGNGVFLRVQVKTAQFLRDSNALFFSTCSQAAGQSRKHYQGQVEVFGVYSPDFDRVYLVPVDLVGRRSASLRLSSSKNNQQKGCHAASDFEVR